ncbi:MAG TPA: 4a-hydroxytetrahydrobiopterin dehydratase [Steroidobacteraceae bacterium]
MSELTERRCKACEAGTPALDPRQAGVLLQQLDPGWSIVEDGKALKRAFRFEDFYRTMAFANAVAWIANAEDHHPDLELGYNYCRVRFSTHSIGGLSDNDFICAAKIDAL